MYLIALLATLKKSLCNQMWSTAYIIPSIVDKHSGKVLAVEDIIQIDVWDFAGQFIFLTTHQTYLSDRCVYFLVFDMSKDLDDTVDEEDVSGTSRKTVLGNYTRTIYFITNLYIHITYKLQISTS